MLLSSLLPTTGGSSGTPAALGYPADTKQFVGGDVNSTTLYRRLAGRAASMAYYASSPYTGMNAPGGLSREGDFTLNTANSWQSLYQFSGRGVLTFLAVAVNWPYNTEYAAHTVYLDVYIDGTRVAYDNDRVSSYPYQKSIFPVVGGILGNYYNGDFIGFSQGYRPFDTGFEIKAYDSQASYLSSVKYAILIGGYRLT